MSIQLQVDTDEIRRASAALNEASYYYGQPGNLPEITAAADSLGSADCHGSAPVREALRLAAQRAMQGLIAVDRLHSMALTRARSLQSSAAEFDRTEELLAAEN